MDMDCRQAVSSYIAYAVDLDSPRIGNVTIVQLGPVVIIWGFVIACACTTIVAFSLAEICSAYPSAGSVYHWAAQVCLLYTSPSPRDAHESRMPSSA